MTSTLARIAVGVDYGIQTLLELFRSELATFNFFPYVVENTTANSAYGVNKTHALFVVPEIENMCSMDGQLRYSVESRDSVDKLAEMYLKAIQLRGLKAKITQLDGDVLREIVSDDGSNGQSQLAVVIYELDYPKNDEWMRDVFDTAVASAIEDLDAYPVSLEA